MDWFISHSPVAGVRPRWSDYPAAAEERRGEVAEAEDGQPFATGAAPDGCPDPPESGRSPLAAAAAAAAVVVAVVAAFATAVAVVAAAAAAVEEEPGCRVVGDAEAVAASVVAFVVAWAAASVVAWAAAWAVASVVAWAAAWAVASVAAWAAAFVVAWAVASVVAWAVAWAAAFVVAWAVAWAAAWAVAWAAASVVALAVASAVAGASEQQHEMNNNEFKSTAVILKCGSSNQFDPMPWGVGGGRGSVP